jgi:LacI family transcriptional regulator
MTTSFTIRRIAELCGVSRGTVDRVLNDRPGVNARTAERIREVTAKLGYRPNAVGRALVGLRNPIRIGVVLSPDYNPFVSGLKRGLAEAAREFAHLGVGIDVRSMTTLESKEQIALLEALVREGVNAISLLPIESPEVARTLRHIVQGGVPVVTFNSDIPEADRLCFVGQDHLAGGRVAGGLMGQIVRRGNVAVIASSNHLLCHVQRVAGFTARLQESYPEVRIASTLENEDRDDLAYGHARALIRSIPDLRGLYLTGGGAAGLGKALREAPVPERIRVVTHDFVPSTVKLVKAGSIDFAIGQDPEAQGYLPIKILHAYLSSGKRPPDTFIRTRIDIRTDGNIEESVPRSEPVDAVERGGAPPPGPFRRRATRPIGQR